MSRYAISPEAISDVDEIITFIARDSRRNALKVWNRLEDTFGQLARQPKMGHARPELRDDSLRVFSVYDYLVIYDPNARPVTILRVVHGARDLRRIGTV
jgi:antitoxin ParD1/3/4/toxin ParE1/3/4